MSTERRSSASAPVARASRPWRVMGKMPMPHRGSLMVLIATFLAGICALDAFAKSVQLGKRFTDKKNGFSFQPPKGWESIPIPPEEKIPGYESEKSSLKPLATYSGRQQYGVTPFAGVHQILDVDSLEEAVKTFEKAFSKQYYSLSKVDEKDLALKGCQARQIIFSSVGGFRVLSTIYFAQGRAYALSSGCATQSWDDLLPTFEASAKTFAILKSAEADADSTATDQLPPGWYKVETKHYNIQANARRERTNQIADAMENIVAQFIRHFSIDEKEWQRPFVKVFDNEKEFGAYAAANGVGGALAWYSPTQGELVCYHTGSKKMNYHVVFHEGFHQFIHQYTGMMDPPIWMNEGCAEYFGGTELNKTTGKFEQGIDSFNMSRLNTIKKAIRENSYVPLKELFKYSQSQYYAKAGLCYAQGWSVAYFLLKSDNEKYRHLIPTLALKLREARERGEGDDDDKDDNGDGEDDDGSDGDDGADDTVDEDDDDEDAGDDGEGEDEGDENGGDDGEGEDEGDDDDGGMIPRLGSKLVWKVQDEVFEGIDIDKMEEKWKAFVLELK